MALGSRKKPTPFSRTSVTVGQSEPRVWATVAASSLTPGDTVPDIGVLTSVAVDAGVVTVRGGNVAQYAADAPVLAFVEPRRAQER